MIAFQTLWTCKQMGLSLSSTSKLSLVQEASQYNDDRAVKKLQSCCLCNLVGDNCDIRIGTRHQTTQHQVKDCHYFGILLVFSRLSEQLKAMQTNQPSIDVASIDVGQFVIDSSEERQLLMNSYKVAITINDNVIV